MDMIYDIYDGYGYDMDRKGIGKVVREMHMERR